MNRSRALAVVVLAASTLAAFPSQAQVTSQMEGNRCVPATKAMAGMITHANVGGHLVVTNVSANPVDVLCPLIKHTSAGSNNDAMSQVTVTFLSGPVAGSSCTVNIWNSSSGPDGSPSLAETPQSLTINSPGTFAVYTGNAQSVSNYWGTTTAWKYAEMKCTLGPSATISNYSYKELGIYQTTTISPASNCYENYDQTGNYVFENTFAGTALGFVEAIGETGGFDFKCELPNNGLSRVWIMVGPSISQQGYPDSTQLWCQNDSTWQLAPQNPLNRDFPSKVLAWTRVNPFTTTYLNCLLWAQGTGTVSSKGDGKILSFKMAR